MDMCRFSGGSEPAGEEITSPSISMVPAVGSRNPAIILSVVVLPHPEGPSSETNSPSSSARVKSFTAVTSSKRRLTLRRTSLLTPPCPS